MLFMFLCSINVIVSPHAIIVFLHFVHSFLNFLLFCSFGLQIHGIY